MKALKTLLAVCTSFTMAACTQMGLATANLPAHFKSHVSVTHDVVFDASHNLALDIYAPKGDTRTLPVIVFFYGGRWTDGKKSQYAFAGTAFAEKGFIAVIPDYRKYPSVKFPAFVDDAAKAVAWTHDYIATYGGDPSRIYLAGHSSGAHLASLVTTDERYLARLGKKSGIVKAFAGLAGPYAFTPDEPDLKDMFGPPENYPQMQATTFIDGREPPMLLLWGADDTAVGKFNMEKLANQINEKHGRVETKVYPGINHVWIVGALSWLGKNRASVLGDVTKFFMKIE